jgi:hypothetical protein
MATGTRIPQSAARAAWDSPPTRDYPWTVYLIIAIVCFGLTVFTSTDYVRSIFERMLQ